MKPMVFGDVEIGQRNTFGPGVVIHGPTTIGDDNFFGAYSVIGGRCRQAHRSVADRSATGAVRSATGAVRSATGAVRIGSENYFGQHSIVHAPVEQVTAVGDVNSIGAGSLVAHDSHIGSHVTLSVNCAVGGHSVILDRSGMGMGSVLHPRTVMGHWSFAGMAAAVTRNVGIGELVVGNPARFLRLNYEAFARGGYGHAEIDDLRRFLETGYIGSELVSRVAAEFVSATARTTRNRVLRSWSDLTLEMSRD